MATNYTTANMNLLVPVVGAELAPTWAQDLNTSLGTIDTHNHSSGQGVQINPNGININASLPFNSNAATSVGLLGLVAQGTGVPTPVNLSLYASGADLYYQDGNGNAVRVTSGGSVNATSSGIASGTATASFVSSVLVVDQSTGVGAPIDAATYILRYNGSYPSPSGNYILLAAPSSLSGGYQITLPAATAATTNAFLVENTSGVVSYVNVDGSTLGISNSVLGVASGGIGTSQIASGAVTGPKIGLAGAQVSSSSGFVDVNYTSYTQVTNLSVSITTTGRPVLVTMQAGNSDGFILTPQTANKALYIGFYKDGTLVSEWSFGNEGSGYITGVTPPQYLDPTPSAASHTYAVYAKIDSGASNGQFNNIILTAVEI